MELFSVLGKLVLDSSEFDRAIDEAQRKADGFEMPDDQELEVTVDTDEFDASASTIESRGGMLESSLTGAFGSIKSALVATGIVGAFVQIGDIMGRMVNLTTKTADAVDKGSRKLQISTGEYQRWDHALQQSGSSIGDLTRGMMNFQNIADAAANGELQDLSAGLEGIEDAEAEIEETGEGVSKRAVWAFKQLNIALKDGNGEWKTGADLMHEAMLALADIDDPDRRGRLARALFGNNANNLNALLDSGRQGIEDLRNEADTLGLVMSEDEIANGVALGDAMSNLSSEWEAIQTALMSDFIPVLREAVDALTGFLSMLNPRNQETSLSQTFASIQAGAMDSARSISMAEGEAIGLVTKLGELGDYWSLDQEGQATWDAMAARAIELFPELSGYIDINAHAIHGNTEEINENIRAWSNLQREQILSVALQDQLTAVAQKQAAAAERLAQAQVQENRAESVRLDTIHRLNAEMEYYGAEGDLLSDNATAEEMADAKRRLKRVMDTRESMGESYMTEQQIDALTSDFETATNEAIRLREEAESLEQEATQAMESYEYQAQILTERIIGTKSSTQDAREELRRLKKDLIGMPQEVTTHINLLPDFVHAYTHAIGSDYIPYDNYPALLHRGEKVLTATEARQTGNGEVDYGRLEDALRGAITSGMQDATVVAVVTDRDVGRGANRYNGNELDAGRFRP